MNHHTDQYYINRCLEGETNAFSYLVDQYKDFVYTIILRMVKNKEWENYPEVEHIHFFCYYIGNYPDLEEEKIIKMCELLNKV